MAVLISYGRRPNLFCFKHHHLGDWDESTMMWFLSCNAMVPLMVSNRSFPRINGDVTMVNVFVGFLAIFPDECRRVSEFSRLPDPCTLSALFGNDCRPLGSQPFSPPMGNKEDSFLRAQGADCQFGDQQVNILLMEEILHHLRCEKEIWPQYGDKLPTATGGIRISSNSINASSSHLTFPVRCWNKPQKTELVGTWSWASEWDISVENKGMAYQQPCLKLGERRGLKQLQNGFPFSFFVLVLLFGNHPEVASSHFITNGTSFTMAPWIWGMLMALVLVGMRNKHHSLVFSHPWSLYFGSI